MGQEADVAVDIEARARPEEWSEHRLSPQPSLHLQHVMTNPFLHGLTLLSMGCRHRGSHKPLRVLAVMVCLVAGAKKAWPMPP